MSKDLLRELVRKTNLVYGHNDYLTLSVITNLLFT